MQTEVAEKFYTVSEYLALEKRAKNKHEYYNGKILKMPGATHIHNEIAANILGVLKNALYKKNFKVYTSDMKIHIPRLQSFVYPDAVVVCEKAELYKDRADIITNPLLIVEISSPSTRQYDRSTKFKHYKTLPSFKEYVLIEQNEPWVISSYKIADNTWKDTEAISLHSSLYLPSIDCTFDLERVYEGIKF